MQTGRLSLFLKALGLLGLVGFLVSHTGCAPSASQLRKVVEENPDIVFKAIEKDPKTFLEVVNKAAREAQMQAREDEAKAETDRMEEEFKNPKAPKISENRAIFGPKDAAVTIVKYSDFLCGHCATGNETLKKVKEEYGDKVRIVYKHLPIFSMEAAKYFEAVAMQDVSKAAKFRDELFHHQGELRAKQDKYLDEAAKKVGANMSKLKKDIDSDEVASRIESDSEEAKEFGFTGTPAFIINGVTLRGAYPYPKFKEVIDRHLNKK